MSLELEIKVFLDFIKNILINFQSCSRITFLKKRKTLASMILLVKTKILSIHNLAHYLVFKFKEEFYCCEEQIRILSEKKKIVNGKFFNAC